MWAVLFLLSCYLGYSTISLWRKDFFWAERLFLGFSLGMGEVSLVMFFMGLINIELNSKNIFVTILTLSVLFTLITIYIKSMKLPRPYGRGIFSPCFVGSGIPPKQKILRIHPRAYALGFLRRGIKFEKNNFFEKLFLVIILVTVMWSFTQTVNWPVWEWDSLALYDFRGKVIAQYHSLATDFFTSQPTLTAYNYVYTFSTSLMHALIYIGGGTNPQFIYSFYYMTLLFLLYFCLRRRISRLESLVLTAVLATTPAILFPSTIAYPNLPYALYFSFSTIYFWEWLRSEKNGYLVVSALFLGISSWIRNTEPYWIVNVIFIFILLLKKRKFIPLFFYLLIFLPLKQLWPIYQGEIFSHAKDLVLSLPLPFNLDLSKIPEVLIFVIRYFIKDWSIYLFILFTTMILLKARIKNNRLILGWLFGYLVLSAGGTFFFSVSFPWWNEIGGSAERLSIFFAPLLLYTISLFWDNSLDLASTFKGSVFYLRWRNKRKKVLEFK